VSVDVVVVGAGPAGAVAATVLARAGARVRLLERAKMPRHKLCGDTLNPGAMAVLERLALDGATRGGVTIGGMRVTGAGGVVVESRYPGGLEGRAISRAHLDAALVNAAVRAGVEYVDGVSVRSAILEQRGAADVVSGVRVGTPQGPREIRAAITIAADGRHSTLAFALGLARHPLRPRRWAIGGYFSGAHGLSDVGEMHIRRAYYLGVAPLPGGLANVCVVKPSSEVERALRNPAATLRAAIERDPALRDRLADAMPASEVHVLGPLAVDMVPGVPPPDGLLLAGDAWGFVDPMTGDGLRFALRGGELAAHAALRALEHGWRGVHGFLAASRDREFSSKWRFNRALRALVGSPAGVWAATRSARVAPGVVRALITRASDCDLAAS
jgi:menaquinone-9 beta-reductase